MAKFSTNPTLYDDCHKIELSFLREHGYLKQNQIQSGTITWSRNGNKTGCISIRVNMNNEHPYIELDYNCNEVPINYRVQLVSKTSNIGNGKVWFFVCPQTGKYCRKLYLIGSYFYSRSAFPGCMYEKQIESNKYRQLGKLFNCHCITDEAYKQIYKKNFKKQYNGKPTKRYLKLLHKIEVEDRKARLSLHGWEKLFLK